MVYVTSDLHGFLVKKFQKFLDKIGFGKDDYLFILGDVIDRGSDGVNFLRWIMAQPNVELILGNHEAMLLSCGFLFENITEASISELSGTDFDLYANWAYNGGDVTLEALYKLKKEEGGKEEIDAILEFLREAPLYETVTVNGKDFILTHSALGNFREDKKLSEYTVDELVWTRPNIHNRYFDDVTLIFGHTPTNYYGTEHLGKILKTDTWIDIDVGVGKGQYPAVLRLDDMKCFYYNQEV